MFQMQPELVRKLFPRLNGRWFGPINLAEIHKQFLGLLAEAFEPKGDKNPFLDAYYCERWKNVVHAIMGVDFSWGGYMEDRAQLWADSYLEPGRAMHVGLDFYVPEGNLVSLPTSARLVDIYDDNGVESDGGWGGRIIFQWMHGYFLLGHLEPEHINRLQIGNTYAAGDIVGVLAPPERNGGWSPHLHFQCMTKFDPEVFVDGYYAPYEGIEADFPNPIDQPW